MSARIAILGFGFSGLMVAANLVRLAEGPCTLYIVDEHADGLGVAYGTTNPLHLLNVRAGNMSAFADAPNHFVDWLASDEGKYEAARLALRTDYGTDDYVPRMLYGRYLLSIWRSTQEIAAQKNIALKLVPTCAVAVEEGEELAVLTTRGDAIAVDEIVLAVGHEMKSILPQLKHPHIVQNPWSHELYSEATHWASPVLILGSGLTAIDIVLSLRRHGYAGKILLASRHAWLPHAHVKPTRPFSFSAEEIAAHKNLFSLLRTVQTTIREQQDWRIVLDGLRHYTASIWQRLSMRDKQRFLRELLPLWNVHRHRMAPEIAERIKAEQARGMLQLVSSRHMRCEVVDETLRVTMDGERFEPSRILNGTGLELNVARSSSTLLKQLMAHSQIEAHATGLGIAADPQFRAWGALYPHMYVLGSLLTGQLLESTAVPELRVQAQQIAASLIV